MATYDNDWFFSILDKVAVEPSEKYETEDLEFKGYRDCNALFNSKELAEEISALANHKGGCIVVGVKDSSDVPHGQWHLQLEGFDALDLDVVSERLRGKLAPKIKLSLDNRCHCGKNYLVIEVPHLTDTLVSTSNGKTCIRDGKSSRPMTPREIEAAVKSLVSYDWSAELIDISVNDGLDQASLQYAINDFKIRREIDSTIEEGNYLEAVGATKNGILTKTGLLFLGKDDVIKKILGDYEFRFSWKTKNGGLIINEVWNGNLLMAINKAKANFDKCNSDHTFKYKTEEFVVPMMDPIAFHEAYLNALVHRDYSNEGMVSVNFTGDQLLITSPGKFYGGITSENIGKHEPRHRNKTLARTLMAHNLVDRAGMGVLRMGIGSLKYGRSFPVFQERGGCIEVALQAEYMRPGIAVLYLENKDKWGIPELLLLNMIYGKGYIPIFSIEARLEKVVTNSWSALKSSVESMPQIEFCGTWEGIFIKVNHTYRSMLNSTRSIKLTDSSNKHVMLYDFLKENIEATNTDITDLFKYKHSSQTSRFLSKSKYIVRRGSGTNARWTLV